MRRSFRGKLIMGWAALVCVVAALWSAAVLQAVGEARARVEEDRNRLDGGTVIFPIAHYVVNGVPGAIYRDRLDAAAALWRERARPIWLLGGGGGSVARASAAAVGKRYLTARGIPGSAILTLDDLPGSPRSLDTTEEIGIAAALVREKAVGSVVVVGEVLHLAQARLVFDDYGVATLLANTPPEQYGMRYQLTRVGALLVTLVDRRGRSLFWLRWIRSNHPNWPWGELVEGRPV